MSIIDDLRAKKQIIEQNKSKKINLEGRLAQQLKQLKDDFDIDTIEEAELLLEEFKKDKVKIEEKLEECKKELDKIEI